MNYRTPTKREHLLMIAFFLIIAGIGYYQFRYLPAHSMINSFLTETDRTLGQMDRIIWPKDILVADGDLQDEANKIERTLARENKKLVRLERKFFPLDSPDDLQKLKVEISAEAQKYGILIRQSKGYNINPQTIMSHKEGLLYHFTRGEFAPRPLLEIRVDTSYGGLQEFLKGLNRLTWRVTVVKFSIAAMDREVAQGRPHPLTATIILAL